MRSNLFYPATALSCSMLSLLLLAAPVLAASDSGNFPVKHVTIVVPFSAGGGTEARARILAAALERLWQSPVGVVCLAGGAGITGMMAAKNAPPDGHTMVLASLGTSALTPNRANVGYNTPQDFRAVAQVSRAAFALGVLRESGITSFSQLLGEARDKDLTYGSPGVGLTQYMMFSELLERIPNVRMRHVPYKGAWEATLALLARHVDAAVLIDSDLLPYVASGEALAIATTGDNRSTLFPDAPTFKELGFDTHLKDTWAGLLAPRATPEGTILLLQEAVKQALQDPELLHAFRNAGISADYADGATLDAQIAREYKEFSEVITRLPQ